MDNSDIAYVVEKLGEFIEPGRIMLVGARCRDIHQQRFRDHPAGRTTRDIDFALALESWDDFRLLKKKFPSPTDAWQQVVINQIPIDLVPFGDVENPPGEVAGDKDHVLKVAGFQQVFQDATDLKLKDNISVKLPSVPGFAGLKLHAWLDRGPQGQYKDATDLALILSWYEENDEALWDRYPLLPSDDQDYMGDLDAMAAQLLGADIGRVFGKQQASFLFERLVSETRPDVELFIDHLITPPEHTHPWERRKVQVNALIDGLKSTLG